MPKQLYKKCKTECDDLEWLYVPDEVYADYDGCRRCLQLFLPYRQEWPAEETFPLVLFIPGSAWYRQEVYNSLPAYSRLAERGIVTAILQFRESTIAPFPAQVEDAKAALRFLAARAEEYHIDTGRIFIAGNSSGGHIALLTAFTQERGVFDTPLYPEVSFRLRGVIAQSAPTDILKCAGEPFPPGFPEGFRPTADLLGVRDVLENRELAEAASCRKYISGDAELPPVLLFHGTEDVQVSVENSRDLYELLKSAGKDVFFYELEGGHGGAVFWSEEILDITEAFIRRQSCPAKEVRDCLKGRQRSADAAPDRKSI